jgi:type IV secretion system protein VirB10
MADNPTDNTHGGAETGQNAVAASEQARAAEELLRQQAAEELKPELQNNTSAVAVSPKQNKIMMIGALVVAGFVVYYFFYGNKNTVAKNPSATATELSSSGPIMRAPLEENVASVTTLPSLPSPPPLVAPTPPPLPPVMPALPNMPNIQVSQDVAAPNFPGGPSTLPPTIDRKDGGDTSARKKSSIMMSGGGSGTAGSDPAQKGNLVQNSDNFYLERTSAAQENAKTIGNMANLIAQGKLIDVILETAINSDFPGTARAIVSRDTYAEAGKNILIPKGSRLIGTYTSGVKKGQKRLAISWNRVIRPDGIDISINSPGVDQLGRTGSEGYTDNKYFEMISNSLLLSTINLGMVQAVSKVIPSSNEKAQTTTTTPPAGGTNPGTPTTTTDASPTQTATSDALKQVGDAFKTVAKDSVTIEATMTIDQGSKLKVFVNKDLVFPGNIASQIRIMQ